MDPSSVDAAETALTASEIVDRRSKMFDRKISPRHREKDQLAVRQFPDERTRQSICGTENHHEIRLASLSEERSTQSLFCQPSTSTPTRNNSEDAISTVDDWIDDDTNAIAVDPSVQSIQIGTGWE